MDQHVTKPLVTVVLYARNDCSPSGVVRVVVVVVVGEIIVVVGSVV